MAYQPSANVKVQILGQTTKEQLALLATQKISKNIVTELTRSIGPDVGSLYNKYVKIFNRDEITNFLWSKHIRPKIESIQTEAALYSLVKETALDVLDNYFSQELSNAGFKPDVVKKKVNEAISAIAFTNLK